MFEKDKIRKISSKLTPKYVQILEKLVYQNLSIDSMHLSVMNIWEELQLCAINIHNEKIFIHTVDHSVVR